MTGNSLCATVSVKTHRPGIPCRHDGKWMKQGDEGVGYWRRNKHWGGTTVERQLRENGAEACRSNSRRKYASFARFWYLSVCQPLTRYNQIKKDLSSCGRARSGTRKSLFDTTGKAFPDAGRASSVHRKSGSRPSENFFQAHHAKETVIWNNKNGISSGQTPRCHFCFTAFRLSKFFTSATACPSMLSNCGGMAERQRTVRRQTGIRVRAPSPPPLSHAPRRL